MTPTMTPLHTDTTAESRFPIAARPLRRANRAAAAAAALAAIWLTAGVAHAADPTGQWMVEDRTARMKVELCADGYYATIDWEKQPGVDSKNPDPGKRGRPLNGVSILMGMKTAANGEWEGQIYNPRDGKVYEAHMTLPGPNALKIEGCMLGFLCGGETWTRTEPTTTGSAATNAAAAKPRSYCPTPR